MILSLPQQIEALLFYKTDAMTESALAKLLGTDARHIEEALGELEESLKGRGIILIRAGGEVMLGTRKEMSLLIEKIGREELEGELSKASVETLSVILYRASVTKSEIDYIRGVNSGFMLRALQIRGLIEKKPNPNDGRGYIYTPTIELYQYLGISKKEELPDYQELILSLNALTEKKAESPDYPRGNESAIE
ncbi:MAG: SMC-Scp complex subunit ScpB [Patescibacteria group bacterium]